MPVGQELDGVAFSSQVAFDAVLAFVDALQGVDWEHVRSRRNERFFRCRRVFLHEPLDVCIGKVANRPPSPHKVVVVDPHLFEYPFVLVEIGESFVLQVGG